jgi:hypothetical protein
LARNQNNVSDGSDISTPGLLLQWSSTIKIQLSLFTLFWFRANQLFAVSPWCRVLSEEATHTNFIFFGLTRAGLEPTIYRTRGEHANHYICREYLAYSVNITLCYLFLKFCYLKQKIWIILKWCGIIQNRKPYHPLLDV